MKDAYFYSDNGYILCNKVYTEAYFLEKDLSDNPLQESALITPFGEGFRAMGIFNLRFFDTDIESEVEELRSKTELKTFNVPVTITTYPTETSFEKLDIGIGMQDYLVLKYYVGNRMMDEYIQQQVTDAEKFLYMITRGKFPSGISYPDILRLMLKNFTITGVDPGVPALIPQLIIAASCRVKNDLGTEFRMVAGQSGKIDLKNYRVASVNEIVGNASVISAIGFERFDEKIAHSLLMSKTGVEQKASPIDKIVTLQGLLD